VERGRELRTDYKLIARAMTRKGNALVKLDRLQEAIEVYRKSLTEHRWVWGGARQFTEWWEGQWVGAWVGVAWAGGG